MNEIAEEINETTLIVHESDQIKNINNFNINMKDNIR